MTGKEFQALELEQQVEYVNGLLQEGNTVDNIRMALGIGKNYIGNNFKKGGYKKDKLTGLYIKASTTGTTKETTNITSVNKANKKALKDKQSINNTKSLESRIESLEKQIEGIMDILNNTNTTATGEGIEIKRFEGEKVARSYKVNIEVQKQFKAFCKAHSEYEVGDILANAMLEFMNKYK